MTPTKKRLAILGSTGSIGTQTLDVVRAFPDEFRVVGLAARRSLALLEEQVREFSPDLVSCEGTSHEKESILSHGCRECAMDDMASHPDVDMLVTATTGDVALAPTCTAIEAGKDVALANKETVVMAGEIVTKLATRHGTAILPLDSEPNAIWQCMRGEAPEVSRLFITASGGALRDTPIDRLAAVMPADALRHPTWSMGAKITIDSATLMNKAFEVIEAHWLFGVPWDDIEVLIHPQSVVHSLVEFLDGSVKAQMGLPDMRLPIQCALFYPRRVRNGNLPTLDLTGSGPLTFEEWDPERYPCFNIAIDIARRGGTWPAALCGADEAAVEMFLSGNIGFTEIPDLIQESLAGHSDVAEPSIPDIKAAAQSAMARARAAAL